MVGCPDEALDDITVTAEAVGAEHRDRHDLDAVVPDAGDPDAVVRRRSDDAGHLSAVAVRVGRRGRGEERRAGDELAGEVGVGAVDARVEHGDDRGPGRVDRAIDLVPADLGEGPLVSERRVVRSGLGGAAPVELDRGDRGVGSKGGDGGVTGLDGMHPEDGDRVEVGGAGGGDGGGLVGGRGAADEGDDVRRDGDGSGSRGGGRIGCWGRGRIGRRGRGRIDRRQRVGRRRRSNRRRWVGDGRRALGRCRRRLRRDRARGRDHGEEQEDDLQSDQDTADTKELP